MCPFNVFKILPDSMSQTIIDLSSDPLINFTSLLIANENTEFVCLVKFLMRVHSLSSFVNVVSGLEWFLKILSFQKFLWFQFLLGKKCLLILWFHLTKFRVFLLLPCNNFSLFQWLNYKFVYLSRQNCYFFVCFFGLYD